VGYSTTLFQLHTLYGVEWYGGIDLEYGDGHCTLKIDPVISRVSCTETCQNNLSLTVGNSP
jgi:hypothetical protein